MSISYYMYTEVNVNGKRQKIHNLAVPAPKNEYFIMEKLNLQKKSHTALLFLNLDVIVIKGNFSADGFIPDFRCKA